MSTTYALCRNRLLFVCHPSIIINCLSRHQRPLFVLKGSNFAENVCCRYKQLTCTIIVLSLPDASFMYLCKQSQTYFRRKHQICHQTSAHLKWRLERCHKRQWLLVWTRIMILNAANIEPRSHIYLYSNTNVEDIFIYVINLKNHAKLSHFYYLIS